MAHCGFGASQGWMDGGALPRARLSAEVFQLSWCSVPSPYYVHYCLSSVCQGRPFVGSSYLGNYVDPLINTPID